MADIMDPQAVEEQSQAEQENYKVYKRRWLVLFAMFSVILTVGIHKSLISIADVVENHMDMNINMYDVMTQVSMYTTMLPILIMARALDYFGLRRVAYMACLMIVCANGLKALCCASDSYVTPWIKANRYYILLLSEAFVGFAQSIAFCFPPKVANAWFAHYENTLALVIIQCGSNIGVSLTNYFTPIFVKDVGDMYKLSYMFLFSGCLTTFIVLSCVTRSSPKIPPSSTASEVNSNLVPFKSGLTVMLSNPNYVLLLLTLSLNIALPQVEQLIIQQILSSQGYPDTFCGIIIAHAYFFGTFFMLMGAAWVDNSANYVKVSRITCLIYALSLATFNVCIVIPNIKNVIVVVNVMASVGCSLMFPALYQVALRSARTIVPDATVAAINVVLQQSICSIIMNLFNPLRKLSPNPNGYQAPLIIFSGLILILNLLYSTSFKPPSREELQRKLRDNNREILVNEQDL